MLFVVSDRLEKQFRDKAYQKYGPKQGYLSEALEDAIMRWIDDE